MTVQKSRWEELLKRYESACATKGYEVEELVDFYLHRRLAALLAVLVSYTQITPNQITLFGLVLGNGACLCLYYGYYQTSTLYYAMAALLMFLWIVSDCADGQVARLCGRGTRTGRILDGVVDGLVLIPNMVLIWYITMDQYGGWIGPFTSGAGFSLWFHAIFYDKLKNIYMEKSTPHETECDGETSESVYQEYLLSAPYSLDAVLLYIYVQYLRTQENVMNSTNDLIHRRPEPVVDDDKQRKCFIRKHRLLIRLASFMGISSHVVGLYIAYFFAALGYQHALLAVCIYIGVGLNLLCGVVFVLYLKSDMKE